MDTQPDLQFRRLDATDMELALALAESCFGLDDPGNLCFGLAPQGPLVAGGEAWGAFERGNLVGAAWMLPPNGGMNEVVAIALPRKRWGHGLFNWMLDELARSASLSGSRELLVRISAGGPGLAEALTDAGFLGPDPEQEDFPRGEWRRPAFDVNSAPLLNN